MPTVGPDDPRLTLCGFARLYGDAGKVDVVLRKYEALLGRPSKGKEVDVPLDGHKAVSREHARIRYSFDASERAAWRAAGGGGWERSWPGLLATHPPCAPRRRPCLGLTAFLALPPHAERWELEVLGKNGVRVNGAHHTPGAAPVPLPSQSLLQIGEVRCYARWLMAASPAMHALLLLLRSAW